MGKRYREAKAPTPLKGKAPGVPLGKATHVVRVMHRECVTRTTRDRYKLKRHAFAVVEYRGTRPVRVLGASDDAATAAIIAGNSANAFVKQGDPARVRELSTCKPLTKKAANKPTRQELHVADIDRVRECRACGGRNKSALCKPRRASSHERSAAKQDLARLKAASF